MTIRGCLRSRNTARVSGLRSAVESDTGRVETRSIWRRLRADEEGSTMVETILVIFFLLTPILLGLFSVTVALISYQQLGNATMVATQTVAAGRGIITDPCARVANTVTNMLPNWNPSNLTYTISILSTSATVNTLNTYGPYTGTLAATCTAGGTALTNAAGNTNGNPVTVQIAYRYNCFPIFGKGIQGTLKQQASLFVN
jgi:Flp pilus assembly protein TadG